MISIAFCPLDPSPKIAPPSLLMPHAPIMLPTNPPMINPGATGSRISALAMPTHLIVFSSHSGTSELMGRVVNVAPPMKTFSDPEETLAEQAARSPLRTACWLLMNTLALPCAKIAAGGGCGGPTGGAPLHVAKSSSVRAARRELTKTFVEQTGAMAPHTLSTSEPSCSPTEAPPATAPPITAAPTTHASTPPNPNVSTEMPTTATETARTAAPTMAPAISPASAPVCVISSAETGGFGHGNKVRRAGSTLTARAAGSS